MKKIITLAIFFIINVISFTYPADNINRDIDKLFKIVPEIQELKIGNEIVTINMRYLLLMTAQIESSFGRNKYNGRYAKTYMQLEEDSARHYVKIMPELKNYIEKNLGRKLQFNTNKDAVYIAYILYMSKIQHHYKWIDKYKYRLYNQHHDVEWFIYKLFYNSVKGASTYTTWVKREKQLTKIILDNM